MYTRYSLRGLQVGWLQLFGVGIAISHLISQALDSSWDSRNEVATKRRCSTFLGSRPPLVGWAGSPSTGTGNTWRSLPSGCPGLGLTFLSILRELGLMESQPAILSGEVGLSTLTHDHYGLEERLRDTPIYSWALHSRSLTRYHAIWFIITSSTKLLSLY